MQKVFYKLFTILLLSIFSFNLTWAAAPGGQANNLSIWLKGDSFAADTSDNAPLLEWKGIGGDWTVDSDNAPNYSKYSFSRQEAPRPC